MCKLFREKMVNLENLATQVNLVNKENLVILVHLEILALKDHLVKMVLMETDIIAPSALESMHKKENLVFQENEEDMDLLDPKDLLENLVMMPTAILENEVKMVNLEGLDNLVMMVHLGNLAIMADLEIILI